MNKSDYRMAWQCMRGMMRYWKELKQAEYEEDEDWAAGAYVIYRDAREGLWFTCRDEESLIPHFYEAYEQRPASPRKSTPLY